MYERIIFLDGHVAEGVLAEIEHDGPRAALIGLAYLNHYPGEHERSDTPGHGSDEDTFELNGYVLSWHRGLGHVALAARVEG